MQAVSDAFQERYLAHQERKKRIMAGAPDYAPSNFMGSDYRLLLTYLASRRSRRIFRALEIEELTIEKILKAASYAPSSCNRRAVSVEKTEIRDFVGGAGWMNKAPLVLLFVANMEAYKSPIEKSYMPYLDTGFMAQNIYLACETLNLACCFVNPNRGEKTFETENNKLITGAMAIGHAA